MSRNQNVVLLDFPDAKRSLSYESFFEDGKQTIEYPAGAHDLCICLDLTHGGDLFITWNGEHHKQLSLPVGSHSLLLSENIPELHGELGLKLAVPGSAPVQLDYRLVSDYPLEYTEYMFRVYKSQRDEQTRKRLQMQCPAPQGGQTLASLSSDKYDAAAGEIERVGRLLGGLHAIDISHMFSITQSLGDSPDRRKMIDSALEALSTQLHKALQGLANVALDVEHARYYQDQQHAGESSPAS